MLNLKIKKIISLFVTAALMGSTGVAVNAETQNNFSVSFGELMDKQEEGYAALTGSNALENFNQTIGEIPAEIPMIDEFVPQGANVFYVDTAGDNSNSGDITSPLSTINEALTRVASLEAAQKQNGSVIYIMGGTYSVNEPISITDSHSSESAPLYISAYNDEKVTFTSGKTISSNKFSTVNKQDIPFSVYSRLNKYSINNIYFVDYSDAGIETINADKRIMFDDSQMMPARYPNQGYDSIKEVVKDGTYTDNNNEIRGGITVEWKPSDERVFSWLDTGEIKVKGQLSNEWSVINEKIIINKAGKTLMGTGGFNPNHSPLAVSHIGSPSHYYYTNVLEELDMQGEWYADNENGLLFIYPMNNIDDYKVSFASNNDYMFKVNNAQNIVFDGIDFNMSERAIQIKNSKQVIIQNSTVRNTENSAISIEDSKKCGLLKTSISDVASGSAVLVSDSADTLKNLTAARNFIQDCYIYNSNRAITTNSIGNIISHNLFQNISNGCITLSGAENIVEYNEFSGVSKDISDAGAVYIGGDLLNRNNTVRFNYIHDSLPNEQNARGIYCDDCSEQNNIYGNIIKNMGNGISIHSGDDTVVKDNIVIGCESGISNSPDYATKKDLMYQRFIKNDGLTAYYELYGISEQQSWNTRYSDILNNKYQKILNMRNAWANDAQLYDKIQNVLKNDAQETSEVCEAAELVTDTGCYYEGNKLISVGESDPWGYGATEYGMNNVTEERNETIIDNINDYDVSSSVSYFDNIGLKNYSVTNDAPSILINDGSEILKSEFKGISWTQASNINYYNIKISTDSSFENVVVDVDTPDEFSLLTTVYDYENDTVTVQNTTDYEFSSNVTYYARVSAINNSSCIEKQTATSETVSFILRDVIETEQEEYTTFEGVVGNISKKVLVEGKIPDTLLYSNSFVTVIVYDNSVNASGLIDDMSKVKQIAQVEVNEDNTYSYTFPIEGNTDNLRVRVRAGKNEIDDNTFNASIQELVEVSLNVAAENDTINFGDIVTAAALIDNRFNAVESYQIMLAGYDADNRLISADMSDEYLCADKVSDNGYATYTVAENVEKVRAFVWTNIETMIPLAEPKDVD